MRLQPPVPGRRRRVLLLSVNSGPAVVGALGGDVGGVGVGGVGVILCAAVGDDGGGGGRTLGQRRRLLHERDRLGLDVDSGPSYPCPEAEKITKKFKRLIIALKS